MDSHVLKWLVSVQSNVIRQLNDVVPVSKSALYATNFLFHEPGSGDSMFETLTQRSWGSIVYCTFEPRDIQCHVAAADLGMPNGIAASADTRTLFVSGVVDQSLLVFRRPSDHAEQYRRGRLQLLCRVPLAAAPDNLFLQRASGALLVTSHLRTLTFVRHAADHDLPAPSLVQRVVWHGDTTGTGAGNAAAPYLEADVPAVFGEGDAPSNETLAVAMQRTCVATVDNIFASPGETRSASDLPAASIAVELSHGRMVLGGVFAYGYLLCQPADVPASS